ncbi:leucine-rich repeat domain-containing protein [Orenia marismortui]|uniref:leucine-rich repeat domain-containing protein n=1 Tax=Orenia marismortui TaxID=46469 RepID=UPI000368CEF9|nr:leucine-rich repeat domain-containing protein [Orenia marismortui]
MNERDKNINTLIFWVAVLWPIILFMALPGEMTPLAVVGLIFLSPFYFFKISLNLMVVMKANRVSEKLIKAVQFIAVICLLLCLGLIFLSDTFDLTFFITVLLIAIVEAGLLWLITKSKLIHIIIYKITERKKIIVIVILILISLFGLYRFSLGFKDKKLYNDVISKLEEVRGKQYEPSLFYSFFRRIPEEKAKLIVELDLSEKGNYESIKGIESLLNLEKLNLSGCGIYTVSQWITFRIDKLSLLTKLNKLQELNLSSNAIKDISSLENLKNLKKLDLSNNYISDISPLSKLNNLQELNLESSRVKDISGLSSLENLQKLNLRKNRNIKNIEYLSNLENLTRLDLGYTGIEDISPLSNLVKLEKLDLSYNDIKDAKGLSNLVSLKELDLSHNDIKDIIGLSNLVKLEKLDLNNNELKSVRYLSKLVRLKELNLSDNELKDIKALSNLVSLIELNLAINKIENIKVLSNLINLQTLIIRDNKIEDIKALSNLINLKVLAISNNLIRGAKERKIIDKLEENKVRIHRW